MARTARQIIAPDWLATLLLCAFAELISLLTWFAPELTPVAFGGFAGVALVASLRDPRMGFLLLVAEAVICGHGHLFTFGPISIRMVLLGSVTLGWVIDLMRLRDKKRFDAMPLLAPLAAMVLVVGWGIMRGLTSGRGGADVIGDANGYAYLLAIPMALDLFRSSLKPLGQVFSGAVLWLSIKSIMLLYLFSHAFGSVLQDLFLWQRRFWLSEITPMGDWQRVFSASDIFLVLAVFLASALFLSKARSRALWVWSSVVMAALVLSMSRSFWLGIIVAAIVGIAWFLKKKYVQPIEVGGALLRMVMTLALGSSLLAVIAYFPVPAKHSYATPATDASRLSGNDAAVSSRWNMLPPLMHAIKAHPVIGNGFGATITYQSDDPRIHALYKGGVITTSAIEWQYLELWLKMGLPGLLAIGWFFIALTGMLVRTVRKTDDPLGRPLALACLMSFVAFVVLNIFTPYINHPLGWMFLTLILIASQPRPDSR